MLEALRARQPGAPLWRIAWWYLVHSVCFIWMASCYRFRAWGLHNIPRTGPVLLLSNHQSYIDPLAIAVASHHRQFYAMARSTLFRNFVFSWLIRSINAVPVKRGDADTAAMRQLIGILQQQNALLIFPEGTRSADGTTGPLAKGIMLLVKRAKPVVVPVAVDGAYDVWPRGRALPKLAGRIGVLFGPPMQAEELIAMQKEHGLESLRQTIETMRLDLAERLK